MSKKASKGGGATFFQPRNTPSHSRGEDTETDRALPHGKGFTEGETAILAALEKINAHLTTMEAAVHSLEQKLEGLDSRVKKVEVTSIALKRKVSDLNPQVVSLQEAQTEFREFKSKAIKSFMMMDTFREQCDNERRADTLRILGFQGGQTAETLEKDIGDFLTQEIDPYGEQTQVQIGQVYRLPSKKNSDGGQPRGTVIVSLGLRSMRDKILAKVASTKNLVSGGGRVLIFPDVSPLTLERRKELLTLRKRFLEVGAQASLWAPARLRVRHRNIQYSFTDPSAGRDLLAQLSENA